MVKALGIMGGTFDPIHYGHLIAAECARVKYKLEKVIFVPARIPPHKNAGKILNENIRCLMVQIATQGNPAFEVSELELRRDGTSYTVDTIEYFQGRYPGTDIYFIMGLDSLLMIDTWKDVERILSICRFIIVTRPGYDIDNDEELKKKLPLNLWGRVCFMQIPGLDISSSDIRGRISAGKPVKYMLPPEIEDYIRTNRIYL